jgi:hypothetical protein
MVAHTFLIDGHPLPVELEPYRNLADGHGFTDWLSQQGGGFPGSKEAREAEAKKLLDAGRSDSPAGPTDPSTGTSTTPGTPPEDTREAKGTTFDINSLNDTDWAILQALEDCRATDRHSSNRTTLSKLSKTWSIGNPDSHHVKDSVKKLKSEKMGLIDTSTGPSGGIWLTAAGIRLVSERTKGA